MTKNPIKLLLRIIDRFGLDEPTEEDSPGDGLFSYAGEWHSAVIGLGIGIVAGYLQIPMFLVGGIAATLGLPMGSRILNRFGFSAKGALVELKREPWYGISFMLIGFIIGAGPQNALVMLRSLGL